MKQAKKILNEIFKYSTFRYPQEEIISTILNGNDSLAILPTGTGKSLTFQIPALVFKGLTIIITPLISLMVDQVQTLQRRGINAQYLNSTLDYRETLAILCNLDDIKLLYISPEKLQNKEFFERIIKQKIDFVCIDEAHTLMWGHDFRKAFLEIKCFIAALAYRPVISAVTATATSKTIKEIIEILDMKSPKIFKTSFDRPNLYYDIIITEQKDKRVKQYLLKNSNKSGIIYTLTVQNTERLANYLQENGINATYYHGQLSSKEKMHNQELFMSGQANVIVCTISFALGIDKPDIRFVINYEMPSSLEDLVQMAGRASRDGAYGECFILFSEKDLRISEYFIENIDYRKKDIRRYKVNQLRAIYSYCRTKECLHKYICNYFGEELPNRCNNCKRCKKKT